MDGGAVGNAGFRCHMLSRHLMPMMSVKTRPTVQKALIVSE